jgi:hypothetical protein
LPSTGRKLELLANGIDDSARLAAVCVCDGPNEAARLAAVGVCERAKQSYPTTKQSRHNKQQVLAKPGCLHKIYYCVFSTPKARNRVEQ